MVIVPLFSVQNMLKENSPCVIKIIAKNIRKI